MTLSLDLRIGPVSFFAGVRLPSRRWWVPGFKLGCCGAVISAFYDGDDITLGVVPVGYLFWSRLLGGWSWQRGALDA